MFSKSHKTTQFWSLRIKIVLVLGLFVWCYTVVSEDFTVQYRQLSQFIQPDTIQYSDIAILLLLTLVNWLLEAYKWQRLVGSQFCSAIRFRESVKQILTAHIAGLLTPAKVGIYGVKPLFYPTAFQKRIAILHFMGSSSQMVITTLIGLIGSLYLGRLFLDTTVFLVLVLVMISCLLAFLFLFRKWSFTPLLRVRTFIWRFPRKIGLQVLGIAFLRYLIFAHQFYFLLYFFEAPVSYTTAMALIGVYYLGSSLLPLAQLLDVFIKSSIAVVVFSSYEIPELHIICITFLMWIFNVVLPILPGSYALLYLDIKGIPKFVMSSS